MVPRTSFGFIVILAVAAVAPLGRSQGRGAAPPPPSSTTGGGTTGVPSTGTTNVPGNSIPSNPNPTNTNTTMGIPQTIPVSGRVMLEDGTAPTEPVVIERVCNGSSRAEGYTDSKGYFFIELGSRNNGVIQDASEVSGGLGTRNLGGLGGGNSGGLGSGAGGTDFRYANCELRAKLAGFRSQTVNLANRRALDDPNIGTILLHRLNGPEGSTISANELEVPKDARKAFEKGQEAVKKGKLDDAAKNYSKALELYHSYAAAWYEMGKLQAYGGDPYTARGSFGEAIKADPKFLPGYVAIADLDMEAKKWKEVVATTNRAASLDAFDFPQIYFYNAVANYNLKNIDAADKSVKQAERLDTRHQYPQIYFLIGLIQGIRQDYPGAAENLRTYLKLAPDGSDAALAKKQLDQLEKATASAAPQKQDR